jgi:hypothetical protein
MAELNYVDAMRFVLLQGIYGSFYEKSLQGVTYLRILKCLHDHLNRHKQVHHHVRTNENQ